jgi:hypothetical protein
MPRVDFARLSPRQYEDMVAVLLSRIRQSHRVDGTGGDGGRDCYFSDESGTDVYELKSFTGRLNEGRRQQVTRSLQRALAKSPRTWSLVVPIDATPREQEWFDSLASAAPTRITWLGKTWLEDNLAAHPDIGRYFAGASEEVVEILREIAREDALPSDAANVARRMAAMVTRLNEIDPYYAFDFTIADGRTVVSFRPRYPDALRDRPISFSAQLKLDDSTPPGLRAAIDDFMLYGSPVQIPAENIDGLSIDAPGGLGSQFTGGGIALDGSVAAADAVEAMYLVLRVPPDPPVRHVLTMDVQHRSTGPAGGFRLQAQDKCGLLALDMRLNPAASTYDAQLRYQYNNQVLPKDAVPVLALCNALAAGEKMAIATLDGHVLALGSGPFNQLNWPDGDGYLRCARQLAEIQELAGAFFPLPIAFAPEDQYWMDYASKLLRGEHVQITWPGSTAQCDREQVRFFLEETAKVGEAFTFFNRSQETLEFAGGRIRLSWVTEIAHSAKLDNLAELKSWYHSHADGRIEMRLVPANNNQMTVRLGGAPEIADVDPAPQAAANTEPRSEPQ